MHFQLSESFNSQFCSQVYQLDRWSESNSEREDRRATECRAPFDFHFYCANRNKEVAWRGNNPPDYHNLPYLIWYDFNKPSATRSIRLQFTIEWWITQTLPLSNTSMNSTIKMKFFAYNAESFMWMGLICFVLSMNLNQWHTSFLKGIWSISSGVSLGFSSNTLNSNPSQICSSYKYWHWFNLSPGIV